MPELTPEELREIRRLHLQLGRRADAVLAGDYRSAVRGRGMEFDEVREYHPGDDVRHIDWNVTARTGEPFIKVFREERQLTVLLVVDVSGSVRTGSGGRDGRTDRRLQLARVAGSLAFASIRNRDRIGLVTFSDRVEHYLPPRRSRGHVWEVIQRIYEGTHTAHGTDLTEALSFAARVMKRRGTIVVVSDFLDAGAWDRPLGQLASRHSVVAACMTDPLDDGLGDLGLVEVEDAETGARRVVDAATLLGRHPVAARLDRLRRAGADALAVDTTDDPIRALHRGLQAGRGRR